MGGLSLKLHPPSFAGHARVCTLARRPGIVSAQGSLGSSDRDSYQRARTNWPVRPFLLAAQELLPPAFSQGGVATGLSSGPQKVGRRLVCHVSESVGL